MDTGREGSRFAGAESGGHLSGDRPRAGDRPTASDHAGEERLPTLGRLVREDDRTDPVLAQYAAAFGEGFGQSALESIIGTACCFLPFQVGNDFILLWR